MKNLNELYKLISTFLVLTSFAGLVLAEDFTNLGGELTNNIPGANGLQVTAPNVTDSELIEKQLTGFIPFHRLTTKSEGLGPDFINSSCGGCHSGNGKGFVGISSKSKNENSMVVKVSLRGVDENGAPRDVPDVGEQFKDKNNSGSRVKSKFRMKLRWRRVNGKYPDGKKYKLRRPRLSYRIKGFKRKVLATSIRMTPAVIGVGLIESIPESAILALSDPNDLNGDGISGEPQYVPDKRNGGMALGRFGFRASHPTVEQQTAAASFHDMGISNELFKAAGEENELSEDQLEIMTVYQMLAGVPAARSQTDEDVLFGQSLFKQANCQSCHTMTFETENSIYSDLDGQTIHPFSDFLLHDMGRGLADKRQEFSASGFEWRTTPLWGLGFLKTVSKVQQHYLHDGRARTIEEAILWHGGEAEASQQAFKNMSKAERDALIKFLKSL
ncbi:MAG: di-heme oxidoredictase family protein [Bdellovibrionota bacterium]